MPEPSSHRTHWEELFEQFDPKRTKEKLDAQVAQQERVVTLARQILNLQHAPGYEEFCKALADIRQHAFDAMVRNEAGNDWMRVLQGQCQAYDSIVQVMLNREARVQALEQGLKDLQNQRALLERPQKQPTEAKP